MTQVEILEERIALLEAAKTELARDGIASISVDGRSVTYIAFGPLNAELARAKQELKMILRQKAGEDPVFEKHDQQFIMGG